MKATRKSLCLAGVFALVAGSLLASRPAQWNISTQEEFLNGEFTGVAVSSDGKLSPAPALESVLDTGEAFIHSVAADKTGNLYVGTGSNGKIFRIPPGGRGSEWAKLDENGVFALAVDSQGRVYAGTSPNGKVYRLSAGGQAETFFNPREKFIWALAVDSSDNIYVGTGPKGIIYKVTAQGNDSVFYDSGESHIVSLAWDREGNLLAGSSPGGLLFRIGRDGSAFVLYDSDMDEIRAIASDRYGNIFAAGLSFSEVDKPSTSGQDDSEQKKPAVTISFKRSAKTDDSGESVEIEGTRQGKKLEIYKIDKEQLVDKLYSEDSSLVFDLLVRDDGTLLAATSDKGRVVAITPSRMLRLLAQSPDDQVTRLIDVGGTIYAATSNLGKVYRLGASPAGKGVYESQALDAGITAAWGKIRWSTTQSGKGPAIFTRSGNTTKPDKTWSEWSGPYTEPTGSQVLSPAARYLQWKAEFTSSGGSALAAGNELESVTVHYLQKNVAPILSKVTVFGAGTALMKLPTANQFAGTSLGGPDSAHLLSLPEAIRKLDSQIVNPPPRQVYVPGARSVSWSAEDPNDDDLVYSVYYRGEGESEWRLAGKNLTDTFLTIDGASLADGSYAFKVKASDQPSNPQGQALEAELVSKPFDVANTVPAVNLSQPQVQGNSATVDFSARVHASTIYQSEYSLDGGDWSIVYPKDGIADSAAEDYTLSLKGLSAGEHVVTIRVVDSVGNLGTAKVALTVR